ncbi:MAG: hypothetical protein Q9168_004599 [Polycauliona sp. 1 TL-2023]
MGAKITVAISQGEFQDLQRTISEHRRREKQLEPIQSLSTQFEHVGIYFQHLFANILTPVSFASNFNFFDIFISANMAIVSFPATLYSAQTPQQRKSNERYARQEAAKRGRPETTTKDSKFAESPISPMWLGSALSLFLDLACPQPEDRPCEDLRDANKVRGWREKKKATAWKAESEWERGPKQEVNPEWMDEPDRWLGPCGPAWLLSDSQSKSSTSRAERTCDLGECPI